MPGYLGGSTSGGGAGGEISFPKELIDPVTKLRVSQPETMIDTDFEYGLQPTKWETVELINNTPSFFSKSGDTTIDGINSITTNAGTREITVKTKLDHGLAAGIPINVQGTKSITADGAYIINSIPDTTTFTYLCKDDQSETLSIEDLYSSIVTGEFFQGSQIRISDSAGLVTDFEPISTLTVTTDSTHGFGRKTPFYFLNINSTISQQFDSSNTSSRSFDSSNSATAQTFDGSNTLSTINIDYSNSSVVGGTISTVVETLTDTNQIVVTHTTENFSLSKKGDPLYYSITTGSGFFSTRPRGVVFISAISDDSTTSSTTFTVSDKPSGEIIELPATISGTFQLANQARTFAGNNINLDTETTVSIVKDTPKVFDGANENGYVGIQSSYSGSLITIDIEGGAPMDVDRQWYSGSMVLYTVEDELAEDGTTVTQAGVAASGLTANTTYFVDSFFQQGSTNRYSFTIRSLPTSDPVPTISGGSGIQKFTEAGISVDKNIFHIKDHGYEEGDMIRYSFPVSGRFDVADAALDEVNFYFVDTRYDQHNFDVLSSIGELVPRNINRTGTDAQTNPITPTEMTVIGFTAPYTFAVTSGSLPTGLTLNTSTGVVSGTSQEVIPEPGREVVITITDSQGNTGFQTHLYQFNQPPFLYAFNSATFNNGGASGENGPNINQARSGVGNPSWANTYLNMTKAGYQRWTVPRNGTYRIETYGTSGGYSNGWGYSGGGGTRMRGDFNLTQGEVIQIVVGQAASSGYATTPGGGGTYVATSNTSPLIVSGGGGGGAPSNYNQRHATTGTNGQSYNYGGGSNGNGGGGTWGRHGGGGFYGSGGGSPYPGQAFANANANGGPGGGGFGGGGGNYDRYNGSGGGGGYSGGGASNWSSSAGGGGSYNGGNNQSNSNQAAYGNGRVNITRL
jgi:hypothetical protein